MIAMPPCALIRWLLPCAGLAGCLREPAPEPLLAVQLSYYKLATAGEYQLVAMVGNFDPERGIVVDLSFGRDDGTAPDELRRVGPLTEDRAELIITLDPDADYHARARAIPREGYDPTAVIRWRTPAWEQAPQPPSDRNDAR